MPVGLICVLVLYEFMIGVATGLGSEDTGLRLSRLPPAHLGRLDRSGCAQSRRDSLSLALARPSGTASSAQSRTSIDCFLAENTTDPEVLHLARRPDAAPPPEIVGSDRRANPLAVPVQLEAPPADVVGEGDAPIEDEIGSAGE